MFNLGLVNGRDKVIPVKDRVASIGGKLDRDQVM